MRVIEAGGPGGGGRRQLVGREPPPRPERDGRLPAGRREGHVRPPALPRTRWQVPDGTAVELAVVELDPPVVDPDLGSVEPRRGLAAAAERAAHHVVDRTEG